MAAQEAAYSSPNGTDLDLACGISYQIDGSLSDSGPGFESGTVQGNPSSLIGFRFKIVVNEKSFQALR